MKAAIRDILITILIAAVVYLGLRTAVQSFRVEGPSMLPNFHTGEWVLANKLVYRLHAPQRGDVIIFRSPQDRKTNLIKRVIGFPGESVDIRNGTVYVHESDGKMTRLEEPYISYMAVGPFAGSVIPANSYFVLGDNRPDSDDSRVGWLVSKQDILGKAWLDTWPPHNWGLAANFRPVEQPAP